MSSPVTVKVGKTECSVEDSHKGCSSETPLATSCFPVCHTAAMQSAHLPCGITLFIPSFPVTLRQLA